MGRLDGETVALGELPMKRTRPSAARGASGRGVGAGRRPPPVELIARVSEER
jgi:hypothetical protein